ncbi:hypothetical protein ACQP2P_36520 [Dactylosporangium sp. CA-139114]|uniref:hypothetical protein n=1 Tax=Dactylosporangium sp. CA-139114 TaxID=3239931 RepID=UPI003D96B058
MLTQRRLRRVGDRARLVTAFAGFRGAVSPAPALAVPSAVAEPDLIVFVTSGVVVLTLLFGLRAPAVVRWARWPEDGGGRQELLPAQSTAVREALDAPPRSWRSRGCGRSTSSISRATRSTTVWSGSNTNSTRR